MTVPEGKATSQGPIQSTATYQGALRVSHSGSFGVRSVDKLVLLTSITSGDSMVYCAAKLRVKIMIGDRFEELGRAHMIHSQELMVPSDDFIDHR